MASAMSGRLAPCGVRGCGLALRNRCRRLTPGPHGAQLLCSAELYKRAEHEHGFAELGLPTLGAGEAFVAVAASAAHSLLLTSAGRVWSWGDNSSGQVRVCIHGAGASESSPCGRRGAQTGHGSGRGRVSAPVPISPFSPARIVQIACGERHSAMLDSEGRLFTCGWSVPGWGGPAGPPPCTVPDSGRLHLAAATTDASGSASTVKLSNPQR